jgi:hypothetical protein
MDNKDSFLQPKVSQYGSHMVMSNVSKPTKTKYCNIDTRFHDDYDNYSQTVTGQQVPWFTMTLPQPIADVKSITAVNIELPISFYNISASLENNVIRIDGSNVVIPDGFYDSARLKVEVIKQLVVSGISGITFDISYSHCIFTNARTTPVVIQTAVKDGVEFDKYNFKSKLGWLLGFRTLSFTIPGGVGQTYRSECLLDLNTPRYLYLAVDEFTSGTQNSFIAPLTNSIVNKNILAKISLDYDRYKYGYVIPANEYNGLLRSETRSYNGKVDLQKLKVQLLNEYGNAIHLNGLDFSFCLKIEYE